MARRVDDTALSQSRTLASTSRRTATDRRANVARFLRLFFGFYYGMRPSDIHRLTWDSIFRDETGSWRLEYVPHKTERVTRGRKVSCKIPQSLMVRLTPLIGLYDKTYVIPRNEKMRRKSTYGLYANAHGRLEDWVNAFMRTEVGVKGQMGSYLLRRDCSKHTIETEGLHPLHGPLQGQGQERVNHTSLTGTNQKDRLVLEDKGMRYSYGKKPVTTWEASKRETKIRLPRGLRSLPACLKFDITESASDMAQVRQFFAQRFVDYISGILKMKSVEVVVYDEPRPVQDLKDGETLQTEAQYRFDGANLPKKIEIWNRTAGKKERISNQVFYAALIHEFIHHYDVCKLLFENTPHTPGFFRRIDALDALMTPDVV